MPLSRLAPRLVPILAFAGLLLSFAVCVGAAVAAPAAAQASAAQALRSRYEILEPKLARNVYGKPLYLLSSEAPRQLRGEVYALVNAPFAAVDAGLAQAASWCDVLILPFNTKHCAATGSGNGLAVRIGRKSDQPPEDAHPIDFRYSVEARSPEYLRLSLEAESGPFGTRDYAIALEAVPVDAQRTFIHLSYSYGFGTMSRLAIQAYLATVGKDKVGFTITGQDAQGKPLYAGGMLGATERNTMRYFLAIEVYLNSLSVPAEARVQKRINDWFTASERYPKQLHEMDRAEYIAMKERETRRVGSGF